MKQELIGRLREMAAKCGSSSVLHKKSSFCTLIEGAGRRQDRFWIQLHDGLVNFQCLADPEFDGVLEELLAGRRLSEWEAALFGTLDLNDATEAEAEEFTCSLISRYYDVASFEELEFTIEDL